MSLQMTLFNIGNPPLVAVESKLNDSLAPWNWTRKDLSKNKLKRLDPETFVSNKLISKVNVMNNTDVSTSRYDSYCLKLFKQLFKKRLKMSFRWIHAREIIKIVSSARMNMPNKNFCAKINLSQVHYSSFIHWKTFTMK